MLGILTFLWIIACAVSFAIPAYFVALWWLRGGVSFDAFNTRYKIRRVLVIRYLVCAFYASGYGLVLAIRALYFIFTGEDVCHGASHG